MILRPRPERAASPALGFYLKRCRAALKYAILGCLKVSQILIPHSLISVSGDKLPLSHFELGIRDLFISYFQRADLESAHKHGNLLSLNAVLGIRYLYYEL
jgi:hypothetical protein